MRKHVAVYVYKLTAMRGKSVLLAPQSGPAPPPMPLPPGNVVTRMDDETLGLSLGITLLFTCLVTCFFVAVFFTKWTKAVALKELQLQEKEMKLNQAKRADDAKFVSTARLGKAFGRV